MRRHSIPTGHRPTGHRPTSHRPTGLGVRAVGLLAALAILALTGGLTLPPASADPASDHPASDRGKLELVLDSSGSMSEPAAGGTTKIKAAKLALHTVVDRLPDAATVGMRVYGATVYSKSDPGACKDSQLVVPIGPADKPALDKAIDRYKPYGETPIAYSLKQAAKDLGAKGQRTILLVSDGEETCDPDPCEVAKALADRGIDLKIDVVGFRVEGKARSQLKCIADAGRGTYYDADSADDLTASLDKLSTRAYRPFSVSGKPVKGSTEPQTAPEISTGQWRTVVDAGGDEPRYFNVPKTPGSTLWISATARPPAGDKSGRKTIGLAAGDLGGDCSVKGKEWTNNPHDMQNVLQAAMVVDPRAKGGEACGKLDHVLLGVGADGGSPGSSWEVELRIDEEPPVPSTLGLPVPDKSEAKLPVTSTWPGTEHATPVVGGTTFSDAPVLKNGTYSDTIVPGERLVYRVRADFGQQVKADVHFPKAGPALTKALPDQGKLNAAYVYGRMYGPERFDMTVDHTIPNGVVSGYDDPSIPSSFALTSPHIRYLNRTADDNKLVGASRAGYYYLEVNMPRHGNKNYAVPFQLKVNVTGDVAGKPAYAKSSTGSSTGSSRGATDTATPGPAPSDSTASGTPGGAGGTGGGSPTSSEADGAGPDLGSISPVAAAAGGLGVVALACVGVALALLRRPR